MVNVMQKCIFLRKQSLVFFRFSEGSVTLKMLRTTGPQTSKLETFECVLLLISWGMMERMLRAGVSCSLDLLSACSTALDV